MGNLRRSPIATAHSPHVFPVPPPLRFPIACLPGQLGMTGAALGLPAVACAPVAWKTGQRLDHAAASASLLSRDCPVAETIADILGMSVPAKVVNVIVGPIAIGIVAAFHASGPRADECFEDETMNGTGDVSPIADEVDANIASVQVRLQLTPD